ncbi:hypothetical protein JCM17960_25640 [Magnetospira thiophila]
MTKEKARKRAKAKAADKTTKRSLPEDPNSQQAHPGRFNPEASSIKGPGKSGGSKNFGGIRRGAARSG